MQVASLYILPSQRGFQWKKVSTSNQSVAKLIFPNEMLRKPFAYSGKNIAVNLTPANMKGQITFSILLCFTGRSVAGGQKYCSELTLFLLLQSFRAQVLLPP